MGGLEQIGCVENVFNNQQVSMNFTNRFNVKAK